MLRNNVSYVLKLIMLIQTTVNPVLFDTSPIWKTSLIWTFCPVPWFPVHFCSSNLANLWNLCSSNLCMVLPWLLNDVCSNWQSYAQFPIATVKAAYCLFLVCMDLSFTFNFCNLKTPLIRLASQIREGSLYIMFVTSKNILHSKCAELVTEH